MFWVYILRCADGSYYTGHTDNLEKRMNQYHTDECEVYIAARRPVELAWSQECATRYEVLSAEQQIKGWSRRKKEAMMHGDWEEVSRLARNKSETVRGEPVEPQTAVGQSAHPSTSSGRTDSLFLPEAFSHEPVEGAGRTDLLPSLAEGVKP
jgi:predicted GIY-YIG superfamily endonuclease